MIESLRWLNFKLIILNSFSNHLDGKDFISEHQLKSDNLQNQKKKKEKEKQVEWID